MPELLLLHTFLAKLALTFTNASGHLVLGLEVACKLVFSENLHVPHSTISQDEGNIPSSGMQVQA